MTASISSTTTSTLARRLATAAMGAATLVAAGLVPTAPPAGAGGAQQPLGFERWQDPSAACGGASSGVDFGLDLADIYDEYAAQMAIAGPADGPSFDQKAKRLIDIEVHSDGSGLANYLYDVVWVCNQGSFALDSWFVPGMSEAEINLIDELDDIVVVDVERYPDGSEWRFSAIVQRNSGKFDWEVLEDTTMLEVSIAARRLNGRVLDVDDVSVCSLDSPSGMACPAIFDAVVVENTGTNHVPTVDLFADFPNAAPAGHQLVDLEVVRTNWVQSANPFEFVISGDPAHVIFSHSHVGRVVDLEVLEIPKRGQGSTFEYRTVNLTNQ